METDMIQDFTVYPVNMILKMILDFLILDIKIHETFQSTKIIVIECHKTVMIQNIAIMNGNIQLAK